MHVLRMVGAYVFKPFGQHMVHESNTAVKSHQFDEEWGAQKRKRKYVTDIVFINAVCVYTNTR